MSKKMCFLLSLMLMAGISGGVARGSVIESFVTSTPGTIDLETTVLNETPVTMTGGTGFTWGGFADNSSGSADQANGQRIEARGDDMFFGGRATENGNYTYTIFDSAGGNTADTTVDLSGGSGTPSIDVTGFLGDTTDAFTITVMIRTGAGNWYTDAASQTVDSETSATLSWDPLAATWNFVAAASALNLDALAGTDEQILSFIGSGTAPTLSAVDGVGILITGDTGNEPFTIEDIVLSDGTALNFPPTVDIGNSNNPRNAYLLDDLDGMPEDPPRVGGAWNPNRDPNGWEPVGRSVRSVEDPEDAFEALTLTWSVIAYEDTQSVGVDPQVAMDAVQFVTPGVNGFDPNAVFFYRGLYTLQLKAEDTGGAIGLGTKPVDVRENFPPSINGNTGRRNRTMYRTDIVGPHASGITSRVTSTGEPFLGWSLNTNDDNYPLNVEAVTQQWRVQKKPVGSTVNFWTTSAQPGSGDRVDYFDFYSGTQDPNLTFSHYGEYVISMEVDDTEFIADPNYEATFTMVDNKRPWNHSAGPDVIANLAKGGTATLAGAVEDDFKFPLKTVWYVDEGPAGADLGAITFDPDNTALDAVVTFVEKGEYRLRLEVGDHSETLDWDANDFLTATVDPTTYARMTLRPSDDAMVRGAAASENENYGARDRLQVRDGAPGGGTHRLSYMKFDLNKIEGNIQIAELRIMSNEAQNTGDTVIFATTYGESGEWFEGEEDGESDPYLGDGITYMKNDLVRGAEIARRQTSEGNWPSGSRRTFNVSAMTIEDDGKVTLELFTDQGGETEDFRSKENFNNDEPPVYRGPELLIAYDPNMAYYPSPAENATEVLPTADLGWRAHDSTSFEVFFSTDESLVINRNAGVSLGTVAAISATDPNGSIDPTPGVGEELAQSTRYYWAVDGDNGVEGEVWDFITVDVPVLVHPDPIGNMIVVPGRPRTDPGTNLEAQPEFYSWTGGVTAVSFDLYLSTNESDVINMVSPAITDITSPFDPNQDVVLALSNGDPGDLTYYWRIAANQASGPALVSEIGSFGADDHERVDSFNDRKPPPASQTGLSNYTGKWTAEGGATLTWINGTLPGTVGPGGSALQLDYNHVSGASKAKFTFIEPRDWSLSINRAALRLQYRGTVDSELDVVTLRITDTSGGTHTEIYSSAEGTDFEHINGGIWLDNTEVKLDLAPFDATVDMTSIKSYSLGVGDGSTASGTIYFDGIQIFSTHCEASKYPYLFSGGDCDVDVNELSIVAERWMESAETITAGTVPTDNLMLYYPFEGTLESDTFSGAVAGTLNQHKGGVTHITTDWSPGGGSTQCIRVDRGDRLQWQNIPAGTLGAANPSATLSIWIKGRDIISFDLQDNGRMNRLEVLQIRATRYPDGNGNQEFMDLTVPENDGAITMVLNSFLAGENNQNHNYNGFNTQPSDWQEQWNHIAFVWDGVSGVTSFYLNGLMIDREGYWPSDADDKVEAFMGERINRIRVPDWATNSGTNIGGYDGYIDEFRLYSRVLTHEEIVALANQASVEQHVIGGNQPDINDDGLINMGDLAELGANYHRTDVLWP